VGGNFLKFKARRRGILHSMQQTAEASSTPTSSSFAGLLAALTAPTPKNAWNNDDLADDVGTLSYEHALRNHARSKPSEPVEWGFAQAADFAATQTKEARQAREAQRASSASFAQTEIPAAEPAWNEEAGPKPADDTFTMLDRNKKCASITIRLSKAECDQLRSRAQQAGLTVSAYLRSCTFEAEALRAQVKEVLAELRKATPVGTEVAPAVARSSAGSESAARRSETRRSEARRSWFGWLRNLMPGWHTSQPLAQS
jgi:hypothetical protein